MTAIWLIIPAAGSGKRFSIDKPKQYYPLLGKTVLEQTVLRFSQRADIKGIVLAVAEEDAWIQSIHLTEKTHCVIGGAERANSVKAALDYLQDYAKADDLVAVHDAARPCIRQSLLDTLFAQARSESAGILPVMMVKETVKRVRHGRIIDSLNRDEIALAQTPQVFPFSLLQQALATQVLVTDDASAVELLGLQPRVIAGDSLNIKITLADDLAIAETNLSRIWQEND